jgi:hypothetical protein
VRWRKLAPMVGGPASARAKEERAIVERDRLFLLEPDFDDPAYPGHRFYCWHCALLEGVLASFPRLTALLDVERIAWPRPRHDVISLVGEENQSLPLLALADDAPAELATGVYCGRRFVSGKDAILSVLSRRHGIPEPHP